MLQYILLAIVGLGVFWIGVYITAKVIVYGATMGGLKAHRDFQTYYQEEEKDNGSRQEREGS